MMSEYERKHIDALKSITLQLKSMNKKLDMLLGVPPKIELPPGVEQITLMEVLDDEKWKNR